jgi:hypothetical protein
MACGGTTGSVQKRLVALSAVQAIEWFTGWVSCIGMDSIMPILIARAASSNFFEAQIVMQVAKVRTDAPDVPLLKGAPQLPVNAKIDYNPGVLNIAADTAGAMFVRFGVAYRFPPGQAQCAADVEMAVAYVQCGDLVGSGTWQLNSTTPNAQQQIISRLDSFGARGQGKIGRHLCERDREPPVEARLPYRRHAKGSS